MGNKIGRKRQVVDEKYTRPQGLYQLRDIDHKKLRKLILDSKLAPCYPGDDEGCTLDLEECPICFLFFPSLNRSKCCSKGICTECFLQMKPSYSARPSQCPFCKTSNYAVEYRGAKSKEEKGVEQVEEQRIIEAQIRMRQQELQDEKRKLLKKGESSSSSRSLPLAEVEYQDMSSGSHSARCFRYSTQDDEAVSSQGSCSVVASARPSHSIQNREDNFDPDLENIMMMQAIWQSIQEQGIQRSPSSCSINNLPSQPLFSEECFNCDSNFPSQPSPPNTLISTMPDLSVPQHICENSISISISNSNSNSNSILQSSANFPLDNWNHDDVQQSSRLLPNPEQTRWIMMMNHGSNLIEPETNYLNPNVVSDAAGRVSMVVPENFEDQMMLTMSVSVAEAGARMNSMELMWL